MPLKNPDIEPKYKKIRQIIGRLAGEHIDLLAKEYFNKFKGTDGNINMSADEYNEINKDIDAITDLFFKMWVLTHKHTLKRKLIIRLKKGDRTVEDFCMFMLKKEMKKNPGKPAPRNAAEKVGRAIKEATLKPEEKGKTLVDKLSDKL